MKRILILRPGALGDFILTLPALRSLRNAFPGASLHLMAPGFASHLPGLSSIIDQVHLYDPPGMHTFFNDALTPDPGLAEFFRQFDCVISYWADRGGHLERQLRRCVQGILLTHPPKPPAGASIHTADFLGQPLAELGVAFKIELPLLPAGRTPAQTSPDFQHRFGPDPARTVLIHPGSGSRKKNWPASKFVELAQRLKEELSLGTVFLEGPADEDACQRIRDLDPVQVLRWWRQPPLHDLASALRVLPITVGNDSGVCHLAAACGCPLVAIFGPTDPVQWRPLGPSVQIVGPSPDLCKITVEQVLDPFLQNWNPPRNLWVAGKEMWP